MLADHMISRDVKYYRGMEDGKLRNSCTIFVRKPLEQRAIVKQKNSRGKNLITEFNSTYCKDERKVV